MFTLLLHKLFTFFLIYVEKRQQRVQISVSIQLKFPTLESLNLGHTFPFPQRPGKSLSYWPLLSLRDSIFVKEHTHTLRAL